jgi:hypothetical protein
MSVGRSELLTATKECGQIKRVTEKRPGTKENGQ